MATHPDPSHTLTLHPHPFHLNAELSTPHPDASSTSRRAKSTSYEERIPTTEDHDAFARHVTNHRSSQADVERTHTRQYDHENDPYQLASKLKTSSELELIRAKASRKRDACGVITFNKESRKARRLQNFYENQNEKIERWLKPVDEHVRLAKQLDGENQLKYQLAVRGSFIANIILACLQLFAAISSGSLALVATMSDAVFDPLSNVTLIVSNRAVKKVDPRTFPSGKARIETAGNIVFSFLMTAVSFVIIVLSATDLARGFEHTTKPLNLAPLISVGIAFCTKLTLFFYCWALRNTYSQVRFLWEDHRNDLIINGFGILTSIGGNKLRWWIDPAGAIIIAIVISILWLRTAYSEFQLLIGITADTPMQQWITYICMHLLLLTFLPCHLEHCCYHLSQLLFSHPYSFPSHLQSVFQPPTHNRTPPHLSHLIGCSQNSNDALPHDHRHRHRPCLPQRPPHHC